MQVEDLVYSVELLNEGQPDSIIPTYYAINGNVFFRYRAGILRINKELYGDLKEYIGKKSRMPYGGILIKLNLPSEASVILHAKRIGYLAENGSKYNHKTLPLLSDILTVEDAKEPK